MLIKFKKLKYISYQKIDIMVIDKFGYDQISSCFPYQLKNIVIPLDSIPYVLIHRFFFYLLVNILMGKTKLFSLYGSLISVLNPKVIITFNDNNDIMSKLHEKFPDKLVISVQNGIRANNKDSLGGLKKINFLPYYYGFGEYEKDLFMQNNINTKNYIKAGSLKLGLALSKYGIKHAYNNDICFISQYRSSNKKKRPELVRKMQIIQKKLFDIVAKYSLYKKLTMSVVMNNNTDDTYYQTELDYFKGNNLNEKIKFIPNDRNYFSAYNIGFSSKLIIALWSTLSIELFGIGKRTIIGGFMHPVWKNDFMELLNNMPSEVLLYEMEKNHIQSKIDTLMNMSDKEYFGKTAFARNYYMRCKEPYPHEMIKNRIAEHMNIALEEV